MDGKLTNRFKTLKESLLDKDKYFKTIRIATYILLAFVGIFMTILNVLTPTIGFNQGINSLLTYTTGIFSIFTLINLLLSLLSKKMSKFCAFCFAIQLIAMFTIFVISGQPEGFSAIWICLLPLASMVFYGRKNGTILSAILFLIIILLLWIRIYQYIPVFNQIMYKDYSESFQKRFPILYVSFFAVSYLLQVIQDYQFSVLRIVNQNNENYSTHDQLTGLFNRKGFYDTLDKKYVEMSYAKIGFVIFDLDHFKDLNDKYGHLAGDAVLVKFAQYLTEKLPDTFCCRWGGEEFLVCYFNDQVKKDDLENLRKTISKVDFEYNDIKMKITVSGGVFETNDKNLGNKLIWLNKADDALYKAKESGRNRIVYY